MVLELATTLGAITGALLVTHLPENFIKGLFGAFLLYAAGIMMRPPPEAAAEVGEQPPSYQVRNHPLGLAVSYVAGNVSGMLGIGGGPIKVPLMYLFMGVPLKVAAEKDASASSMTPPAAARAADEAKR
jgi:hypothetical protein